MRTTIGFVLAATTTLACSSGDDSQPQGSTRWTTTRRAEQWAGAMQVVLDIGSNPAQCEGRR
jgi:hypothetical protein